MNARLVATSVAGLLLGFLASCALASGPVIADKNLNITLTLPEGFEPVPDFHSPPNTDVRHAYRRMNSDGTAGAYIFIETLGGTIDREPMNEKEVLKHGVERLYREKWKSFEVDVCVLKEILGGATCVTRNVQVPIVPRAVQLRVVGLESRDAELAALTQTLLASLDGPSNWLTNEQRGERLGEGLMIMTLWIVGIGAFVYCMAAWRTRSFRTKAFSIGHSMEWANQKIRPSWAWYLLPAYLLYATEFASGFVFMDAMERRGLHETKLWLAIVGSCSAQLVTLIIGGIIMWRRVKCKRRILANPLPAIPPMPPPIPGS